MVECNKISNCRCAIISNLFVFTHFSDSLNWIKFYTNFSVCDTATQMLFCPFLFLFLPPPTPFLLRHLSLPFHLSPPSPSLSSYFVLSLSLSLPPPPLSLLKLSAYRIRIFDRKMSTQNMQWNVACTRPYTKNMKPVLINWRTLNVTLDVVKSQDSLLPHNRLLFIILYASKRICK